MALSSFGHGIIQLTKSIFEKLFKIAEYTSKLIRPSFLKLSMVIIQAWIASYSVSARCLSTKAMFYTFCKRSNSFIKTKLA